jgi:peptidoglycan hydrolase-like protein with peptidoglycan-binding domain
LAKDDDAMEKMGTSRAIQVTVAVVVVLVAAGAGVTVAVMRHGIPPAGRRATAASRRHKPKPIPALTLTSVTPSASASNVAFHPEIALTFSSPIAEGSTLPSISPPVPGRWSRPAPKTLVFDPSVRFFPLERVTVDVPGGPAGIRGTDGGLISSDVAWHFTVQDASTLRLQQLLAELGYLPVAFEPSSLATPASGGAEAAPAPSNGRSMANALATEPTVPDAISLAPSPGAFAWRYPAMPPQLSTLWSPGNFNVVTEGAVMAFEADHGLPTDGVAGAVLWRSLLDAVAQRVVTTRPYTWVVVSETDPETLYVWRAGHVVYDTPANTGIAVAPTELGTWPVYLRFPSTTMSGTNPDGTHYSDPGVPWVAYFHGGDAVHGFWRSTFGFPQSLGCVELPITNAAVVYSYDTYGTLVTVTTGDRAAEFATAAP